MYKGNRAYWEPFLNFYTSAVQSEDPLDPEVRRRIEKSRTIKHACVLALQSMLEGRSDTVVHAALAAKIPLGVLRRRLCRVHLMLEGVEKEGDMDKEHCRDLASQLRSDGYILVGVLDELARNDPDAAAQIQRPTKGTL